MVLLYSSKRRAEVPKQANTIIESFADPTNVPTRVRHALSQPDFFELTAAKKLNAFMLKAFSEEKVLKKELTHD